MILNTMKKKEMKSIKQDKHIQRKKSLKWRMIAGGSIIVIFLAAASFFFLYQNGREKEEAKRKEAIRKEEQEKRLENAMKAIDARYVSYLADKGGSVPAAVEERKEFSEWFFENYEETVTENVLNAAEDGAISDIEIYEAVGETMHVISDRYDGYLKDNETARQYGIYERKGKEAGQAEITIAGDLCFAEDGFVLDHYDTVNDLKQCISPEILEITNQSDIFYLNHEFCMSGRGVPLNGKYYTFRAKPERMELLKEMGTDLVTLANNHVYDYGEDALLDTFGYLQQAGIPYVGGGKNIEEAKRPVYFIVNGIKIGFVGASNAEKLRFTPQAEADSAGVLLAYDTTEYNQVIEETAKQCDYLIAYIHWGTEDTNDFNTKQQEMGREFLNAGADIVVGGHPHVLQGIEYVDGKPIIYSLGDFWFNSETKYTGLLKLNIGIEGLKEMSFVPCIQTNYTTQYLKTEEEQSELLQFLESLSPNVEINHDGVISERPLSF